MCNQRIANKIFRRCFFLVKMCTYTQLWQFFVTFLMMDLLVFFLDESNTIYLRVVPVTQDPPQVEDHHVPIFIVNRNIFVSSQWDLTTQQVNRSQWPTDVYKWLYLKALISYCHAVFFFWLTDTPVYWWVQSRSENSCRNRCWNQLGESVHTKHGVSLVVFASL